MTDRTPLSVLPAMVPLIRFGGMSIAREALQNSSIQVSKSTVRYGGWLRPQTKS